MIKVPAPLRLFPAIVQSTSMKNVISIISLVWLSMLYTSVFADTVLLDDPFSQSRTVQDLPATAHWFLRGSNSGNLTTETGALKYTSPAAVANILTYFTTNSSACTLQDQETVSLRFGINLSQQIDVSDGIRIGLFDSTDIRITGDGLSWMLSQFNLYKGYSIWLNPGSTGASLKKRTGTSTALFSSSANTTLITDSATNPNLMAGQSALCVLQLTRDNNDLIVHADINGMQLHYVDTSAPSFTFDTLALQISTTALPLGETLETRNATISIEQPGTADITIDWTNTLQEISPAVYSVNSPAGFFEDRVSDPDWYNLIDYLSPALVRLHSTAIIQKSWMFTGDETWNYANISNSLAAGTLPSGTERMITIYRWPDSFDQDGDGLLDSDRLEDFTALCADLVRYINIELGYDVPYWEITNERDYFYWDLGTNGVQQLADIYNTVAEAMRAVDPSIKLGGPAAQSVSPSSYLIEFAKQTSAQLDFLSYHAYASGDGADSDYKIYNSASRMGATAASFIEQLKAAVPEKEIEVHLNEYNISWSWENPEPRMRNHKGAVFDALMMIGAASSGLTAANAWNAEDGIYGKGNLYGDIHPNAHIYHYFNHYLQGATLGVTNSNPTDIAVLVTQSTHLHSKGIAIVNRSNSRQEVTVQHLQAQENGWLSIRTDEEGLHNSNSLNPFAAPLTLPPHSVSIYWQSAMEPWLSFSNQATPALTWPSIPGIIYQLGHSQDLQTWTPLTSVTGAASSHTSFTPDMGSPKNFYKFIEGPAE